MKWGILILFPGFINIVLQCFFTAAKASVNSGNLIVGIGEVLKINTTAPSIVKKNCSSCNYNASHEKRSSSHGEHLAAVFRFSGNIEFRNGSTVQVFGKYGLSITSQNGHILIETDINMTCTEMVLDERCLGGFTQSSVEPFKDRNKKSLYKGLGPGGLNNSGGFKLDSICVPGSSHGGIGLPQGYSLYSDQTYDQQDTVSLLGGSGGSCAFRPESVAGGGAIEIVAHKGCITINAIIRASAQNETVESCSGGSGGLIRLNASHVELKEQGKLIVDGGNGKPRIGAGLGAANGLGGGAGGIIQIISPAGRLPLEALSLKRGTKYAKCFTEAEHGYYYFVGDNSRGANEEIYPSTNPYNWSSSSSLSSPFRCFRVTPTHKISIITDSVLSPSVSQVQSSTPSTPQGIITDSVLSPSASQVQSSTPSTQQGFTGTTFIVTSPVKIPTTSPLQPSSMTQSAIMGTATDSVLSPSASQVQSSTPSTQQGPWQILTILHIS